MSATDTTYTAHVSPADSERKLDVTITKDIRGGISGPCDSFTYHADASLSGLVEAIERHGFKLAAEWKTAIAYDGLRLTARLERAA